MYLQVGFRACVIVRATVRLTVYLALRPTVRALICSAGGAAADPAPDERPATAHPDPFARALAGQRSWGLVERARSAAHARFALCRKRAVHAARINSANLGSCKRHVSLPRFCVLLLSEVRR
jgi:hypothetical protein